jgi:uncharacterized protein YndB with AHSA1/START domain
MQTSPIEMERVYNADTKTVWNALIDPAKMKEWYFDLPGFEARVGYEFQFYGGTKDNQYLHLCRIMEVVPEKKLSYTWRYEGYEGNTLVTFELFPENDDQTRLKLTHEGLETLPQNVKDFDTGNFVKGWTAILGTSLMNYLNK